MQSQQILLNYYFYGYELDGWGIESRCEWDLPCPSRPALWPTQPPVQ